MDPLIRKFTLDIWKTTFYSKEFLVDWFTLHLGCKRQFLLELENSLIKYLGPLSYRRISPSSSKISRPKSVNQKDRASFSSIVVLTLSSGSAGKNIALVTGLNNKQTNIKVRATHLEAERSLSAGGTEGTRQAVVLLLPIRLGGQQSSTYECG